MLVIESALALRRDGVKMPWGSIASGLERFGNAGCFDILSVAPAVIVDSASEREEILSILETFEQTVEPLGNFALCIKTDSAQKLDAQLSTFESRKIDKLIVFGLSEIDMTERLHKCAERVICESVADAAKEVYAASKENLTVLCFGSVAFARDIKTEFIKLMGL